MIKPAADLGRRLYIDYRELLVSTTDILLIVKSKNKTYRFKPLAEGKQDAARALHDLSDGITAFRQR